MKRSRRSRKKEPNRSHRKFLRYVRRKIRKYYASPEGRKFLLHHAPLIVKIVLVNLDRVRDILKGQYSSSRRGKKPKDPVCMFRSLLVMTLAGETSITQWVAQMRAVPLFAILSGFSPDDVPGVGTFYDFIKRLYPQKYGFFILSEDGTRPFKPKPKKKRKQGEKIPPRHPGIVDKLVNRIISGYEIPLTNHSEEILNRILKECFVDVSLAKGILGDLNGLSLSGDGTMVKSGGSPYGVKVCKCKEKGIYRCDCPRRFSDPEARWGWDSHREIYVYGRSLYELIAPDSPYDLPVFLKMTQAQRHDSVSGVVTLHEARKLYDDYCFNEFSGDSAHDAYPIYRLLDHWDMGAIIALNPKNEGHFIYDPPIKVTDNGVPICKGKFEMTYHGYCKDRFRLKWRCPQVCGKVTDCEHFNCSDSDYGRVVYTRAKWDLRIFTRTPRGTDLFKKRYAKHSGSERSNKRKKVDYGLERTRVRSNRQWFTRCALTAMCQHLDAWYQEIKIDPSSLINCWVG